MQKYYFILVVLSLAIVWQSCDGSLISASGRSYSTSLAIDDALNVTTFSQEYVYDVGISTQKISISLSRTIYDQFSSLERTISYRGTERPPSWEADYYNYFLSVDIDETTLKNVLAAIEKTNPGLTNTQLLEHLIAYVQGGLKYDWQAIQNQDDRLEFPYETMFAKKGTCADKSLILAKLLTLAGYDASLLAFPKANHIAVGLRVPKGYGSFDTDYIFIETTDYTSIGIIPKEYLGVNDLDENPTIIPIYNNGKAVFTDIINYQEELATSASKYGEAYLTASAKEKQMLQEMFKLNEAIEEYKSKLGHLNCEEAANHGILKTCQTYSNQIYERAKRYNELVRILNTLRGEAASS